MSIRPDHWIRRMAREHSMIEPFEENQVRDGVVSYGVSSYGYDLRVSDEFKIFTNVYAATVDPKNFDPREIPVMTDADNIETRVAHDTLGATDLPERRRRDRLTVREP